MYKDSMKLFHHARIHTVNDNVEIRALQRFEIILYNVMHLVYYSRILESVYVLRPNIILKF